jgi:6-phosphogluconolactonase/glucosamine-6-phosphate isomerase/deaminase
MTVKRAERYEKKKRSEEISFNKWREANMDEWLAFVRDDPRLNTSVAKDDIFDYKQKLVVWREGHKDFEFFRGL